ncbi:hypothetical protein E3P77_01929 [Wallemia ichthyophaga]|nr:hypothetical protein E3P77_01929 [Wallemia ichthyophaga]
MNLSLTPSERHAFAHFYSIAEKGNGIVSGESAVAFFSYSGLAPLQLGQIWQLSDRNNNGFLDQPGFSVALRLIGHVQNNQPVSDDLVDKPGPIPQFDGIPPPPAISSPVSSPIAHSNPSNSPPPVQIDEKSRFTKIFAGSGPTNGLLSGDKARDIFIKSKLPFEVLGQIWNLADTQNRGSLDLTDFIIGMHLIQCYMNKSIASLPQKLPQGFYEQISGGRNLSSPIPRQSTGSTQPGSPPPSRQVRFAAVGDTDSPQLPTQNTPANTPHTPHTPLNTEISPQEKSNYDGFYKSLNPSGNGVLEADKAVDFFSKSGLPIDVLANVWDLADVRKSGSLSKDEFAIAMHLIHRCLAGNPLPPTLPDSLIPASSRMPGTAANASTTPRKPTDDLFDLMGDESDLQPQHSGAPPPLSTQPTGLSAQGTGLSAQSTGLSAQFSGSQPNALQQGVTGWQNSPAQQQQQQPQPQRPQPQSTPQPQSQARSPFENPSEHAQPRTALVDDLLGDSDVQQTKLHEDAVAAEAARGQLSATDRALSDYQTRRAELERLVEAGDAERLNLEHRLSNAHKAHDTEAHLVSDLQVKLTEVTAERRRLDHELISAESDVSALKVERAELETAYMREKEEARVVKAKVLEISKHTTDMRQSLSELRETKVVAHGENEDAVEQLRLAESDRDLAADELKRYSNVDPAVALPPPGDEELDDTLKGIEDSRVHPSVKAEDLDTPVAMDEHAADATDRSDIAAAANVKDTTDATSTAENLDDKNLSPALDMAAATALPISPDSEAHHEHQDVSSVLSPASAKSTNPFDNLTPSASATTAIKDEEAFKGTRAQDDELVDEDPFAGAGGHDEYDGAHDANDTRDSHLTDMNAAAEVESESNKGTGIALTPFQDQFSKMGVEEGENEPRVVKSEDANDDANLKASDKINANESASVSVSDFDDAFRGFDSNSKSDKANMDNSRAAFDESFAPAASTGAYVHSSATDSSPFDSFTPTASTAEIVPPPAAEKHDVSSPFDSFTPPPTTTTTTTHSKGKERGDVSSDDDEGPEELPELSAQPPNLNPNKDEFDDAFASFPTDTSASAQKESSNKNPFEAMMGSGAFDKNEKDDKDEDEFDTSFGDLPAAQIAAGNVNGDQNDFENDEAFDFVPDFDQPGTSNKAAPNKAFDDFSETFSVKSPGSEQAENTAKPNLPPRLNEPEDDDIKQVKQLVNMGFDRPQAIEALEQTGFNVEKALNKLLKRVTINSTKPTLFERRMQPNNASGSDTVKNPRVTLPPLPSENMSNSNNLSSTSNTRALFPRTPFPGHSLGERTPLLNPPSPAPSYLGSKTLGKAISRQANKYKRGYDDFYENDMVESGKGVRTYAHTHTSIDYIHDKVKEGVRLRRLLRKKGIRGFIYKSFDRAQGWIAVTIIGIVTAIIAFSIVRTESFLFSFKSGYCSSSYLQSKQFCCDNNYTINQDNNVISLFSTSTDCPDWISWEEKLGKRSARLANMTLAVGFAFISSVITVYISASDAPWVNNSSTAHLDAYHHAASGRRQSTSTPSPASIVPQPSLSSHRDSISNYLYSNDANKTASLHSRSISRKSSSDGGNESSSSDLEEELLAHSDPGGAQYDTNNLQSKPTAEKSQSGDVQAYPVMYFAAGSGIPEMKAILSGFVIRGYLGVCTLFCKCIGLAFSVASGLNLGKEGPMVQIAACVGNITSRFIRKFETNEAKRRELISAACAAGVSVAFGAPIGGVLFALEEVCTYFPPKVMWRAFYCASLAAVTLKFLDPFGTGKTVLFQVTYDQDWKFFELPFFFVIAIAGGIYGAYFSKFNIWWGKNVRMRTAVKSHPIVEVVLITLITAVISSYNPLTEMGGTELVSTLLSECPSKTSGKKLKGIFATLCAKEGQAPWSILKTISLAMIIKGVLTVVTFGMKLPAGIFIPTLAVGACFGRMVGLVVEYWSKVMPDLAIFNQCVGQEKCMLTAIYALIGAASALSGVTRMTISLVVIVCELTGTLNYAVPSMLSILIAKTLADTIEQKGIYDQLIDMNRLPYLDAKHEYKFGKDSVTDVATKKIPVIRIDVEHSVCTLLDKLDTLVLKGLSDSGFPLIIEDEGVVRLVGYIAANELEHALDSLSHNPTAGVRFAQFDTLQNSILTQSTSKSNNNRNPPKRFSTVVCDGAPLSANPYDLSAYCDLSPLVVRPEAPMALVHDNFSKLGARQVFVVDSVGGFQGVVYRKRWIEYLKSFE